MRIEVRGRNMEVTDELRDTWRSASHASASRYRSLAVLEVELTEDETPRSPTARWRRRRSPQARHAARPRGIARHAALDPRDRRGPAPPGQEASRQAPQAQRDPQDGRSIALLQLIAVLPNYGAAAPVHAQPYPPRQASRILLTENRPLTASTTVVIGAAIVASALTFGRRTRPWPLPSRQRSQ